VAGVEDDIHVRVANSSDSKKEKFRLGWKGRERTDGNLFDARPNPHLHRAQAAGGMKSGALELSGDDLDYDNLSYYAAPEIQHVSIYCAGLGAQRTTRPMFYYLQRAFPSTPRWQVQFAPELTEQASFAVVATNLAPSQIAALRHWMESGKSALLVLADSYAARRSGLLDLQEARLTEADGEFRLAGLD
jgi:hypothetical protein